MGEEFYSSQQFTYFLSKNVFLSVKITLGNFEYVKTCMFELYWFLFSIRSD